MIVVRIERSATSLRVFVPAPGFRAPVIAQLVSVAAAACICAYLLRDYPYWRLGFGLFYTYVGAKAFRVSYQPTSIVVDTGTLRVTTLGWLSDRTEQFELAPDLELSVEVSGERMQIELFPMHGLRLQQGERRAEVLRGHDAATLNALRKQIVAWRRYGFMAKQ